jgi:hypothetical protein
LATGAERETGRGSVGAVRQLSALR